MIRSLAIAMAVCLATPALATGKAKAPPSPAEKAAAELKARISTVRHQIDDTLAALTRFDNDCASSNHREFSVSGWDPIGRCHSQFEYVQGDAARLGIYSKALKRDATALKGQYTGTDEVLVVVSAYADYVATAAVLDLLTKGVEEDAKLPWPKEEVAATDAEKESEKK